MSGSTSSNSFAQEVANYISQNSSGSVASISSAAATYGSQLAASYISAGIQNVESALGGVASPSSSSSSTSSSSSGSSTGMSLSALIEQGISQFAPQLSSSSSSSSGSSSSGGSLTSLISSGIQNNLPAGVSLNGSTLSFPAISTPLGSFNASVQNGVLSVMPSSSS